MQTNIVTKVAVAVVVLLIALPGIGKGDYITGFETSDNAGYVAGSTIDGVDGWVRTNGQTTDNLVMSDVVYSGTQAMRLGRDSSGTAAWASDYKLFTAPDTSDGRHTIAEVYMASQADVVGSYIYFGQDVLGDPTNTGNTAAQFGFTSSNHFVYRDGATSKTVPDITYAANTYYHFVADIDLVNKTFDLTITGTGVNVTINDIAFRNANVSEISWVTVLNSSKSGAPNRLLWADNLSVTASSIPEPATTALLALGAVGVLLRRRKN